MAPALTPDAPRGNSLGPAKENANVQAYLQRKYFTLFQKALKTLPAASIDALGTWIAANPPASDTAAHRKTFFDALRVATIEDGAAVTPEE